MRRVIDGIPPRYRWSFLPIITVGSCHVQSHEDIIFAEDSQRINVAGCTHSQRLPPVEPAREPSQDYPSRLRRTMWLDPAFLIQGQLFAQTEMFCGECGVGAQAEEEEAQAIAQGRQQT